MRKLVFLFILGAPALALADANINANANHTVEIEIADAGAGHWDAARFVLAVSPSSQTVSFSTHSGDSHFEIGVRLDPNTHGYDVHLQRKGGAAPGGSTSSSPARPSPTASAPSSSTARPAA